MRVVVNTSPLIALERIGKLDLLRQLFGTVVRPQAVLDELVAGEGRYALSPALRSADWIVTEPNPPECIFRKDLGPGETAVIALAVKSGAELVVLDDLQARLVAKSLGLRITGTLGLLRAAYEAGLLDDLQGAYGELQKVGFRLPASLKSGEALC